MLPTAMERLHWARKRASFRPSIDLPIGVVAFVGTMIYLSHDAARAELKQYVIATVIAALASPVVHFIWFLLNALAAGEAILRIRLSVAEQQRATARKSEAGYIAQARNRDHQESELRQFGTILPPTRPFTDGEEALVAPVLATFEGLLDKAIAAGKDLSGPAIQVLNAGRRAGELRLGQPAQDTQRHIDALVGVVKSAPAGVNWSAQLLTLYIKYAGWRGALVSLARSTRMTGMESYRTWYDVDRALEHEIQATLHPTVRGSHQTEEDYVKRTVAAYLDEWQEQRVDVAEYEPPAPTN